MEVLPVKFRRAAATPVFSGSYILLMASFRLSASLILPGADERVDLKAGVRLREGSSDPGRGPNDETQAAELNREQSLVRNSPSRREPAHRALRGT